MNFANINKGDNTKASPLYYSVQFTDFESNEFTKYLIDKGANVNAAVSEFAGYTSLHMASWFGNIKAVIMLIKSGANVNAVDERGYTPIFSALWENEATSRKNKLDVIKYLITSGAKLNQVGKKGEKLLDLAREYLPEAVTWLEHPENLLSIQELETSFNIITANSDANSEEKHINNTSSVVNQVSSISYNNKLLDHFELLIEVSNAGKLKLSEAINKSMGLDNDLVEQVIANNDIEILLAGLMSLQ